MSSQQPWREDGRGVLEDMVSGIEQQDFEFYAVCVIIIQGDLLQITGTGGAHDEPGNGAGSGFSGSRSEGSKGSSIPESLSVKLKRKLSPGLLGFSFREVHGMKTHLAVASAGWGRRLKKASGKDYYFLIKPCP